MLAGGFTEGMTGQLVRASGFYNDGDKAAALPAAVAPEGAGRADEPWVTPEHGAGAAGTELLSGAGLRVFRRARREKEGLR